MVRKLYRDSRGRFETPRKAVSVQTIFATGRITRPKAIRPKFAIPRPFVVHAKLAMTKGRRGGTIEMEAVNLIIANDPEAAKDQMFNDIISRFPGIEFSKIKFFANSASPLDVKTFKQGRISWRSEAEKRAGRPSKQLTLTPFL